VAGCVLLCAPLAWAVVAGRRRHRERQAEREAAIRSVLYRTLDEPGPAVRILDDLKDSDRKMLETKARSLLSALRGEDREALARLLESQGATETARRQCRSRRTGARVSGCRLLGDVGSSFAVLDLVPLLDDHRPAVRMAAARALGRLGHPTAVVPLLGAVARGNRVPVDVAADAIQQIRDWPMSQLQPCLSDPSEPIRALAVELLGRFQSVESVEDLIDFVEGDPATGVRVRAARALARIGSPRAVPPLVACVQSGPPALRAEAISALGRMGAAAAVPSLRLTLLGPSLQLSQAAANALSAIAPQGIQVLQEIADDDRHPAGSTARRALAAGKAMGPGRLPEPSPLSG
jgi:HEAT repeat protein